jgi:hypothetical protein
MIARVEKFRLMLPLLLRENGEKLDWVQAISLPRERERFISRRVF